MGESGKQGAEWAKRLVEGLHEELRSEYGKLGKATAAVGVDPSYPKKRIATGTMDLLRFCSLVHAAGKDLTTFVSDVLDVAPRFDLIKRPRGDEPEIIQKARARFLEGATGTIVVDHVEAMDDLRYDDPERACQGISAAIEYLSPADTVFALGVYASGCRALLRVQSSWFALSAGFELASHHNLHWHKANLLQRSAVVHLTHCDYGKALAASEAASILYARRGDLPGLAQTLIDQGSILYEMGRIEEAVASFTQGLDLLPSSHHRHCCAGHHALALHLFYQGEHEKALSHLAELTPLAKSRELLGKVQWLHGCCLAELGRSEEAMQMLTRALERLATTSRADAALLVCDRARYLLRWSRVGEAYEEARTMRTLVFQMQEQSPRIAAAARDLASVELETGNRLTLALVEQVKAQIEDARKGKPAG